MKLSQAWAQFWNRWSCQCQGTSGPCGNEMSSTKKSGADLEGDEYLYIFQK